VAAPGPEVAPEDLLRAQWYRLFARFLSAPPGPADLQAAAALEGDATELGHAVSRFAAACAAATAGEVQRQFHDLFIGLARGEIVPFASYYLTGFLNEKPLARLRQDMARLGVARRSEVADPEDHIAALLEMMAGFIDGGLGGALSLEEQKAFFDVHIGSWAAVLFRDMEAVNSSLIYQRLGTVGRIFLSIEEGAFAMVADTASRTGASPRARATEDWHDDKGSA
jgi:TorA maturation chaperone TorD